MSQRPSKLCKVFVIEILVCSILMCGVSYMIVIYSLRHSRFAHGIEKRRIKREGENRNEGKQKILGEKGNIKDIAIYTEVASLMKSDNIRENSRFYSSYPHPPGSDRNADLARDMASKWKQYGMDKTKIYTYRVLLSYPKKPAQIHLLQNSRLTKVVIIGNEPPFANTEMKGQPIFPFHAYSKSGNITAQIVYCNYGIKKDYKKLKRLGIKVKNKIVLIRYGSPKSRSDLVKLAAHHGAVAILFYQDPFDHTFFGEEYPHGWMLNKFGVQRGNIWNNAGINGDGLSKGYPSKKGYFRSQSLPKNYLHKIPSQPISAATAVEIFDFMNDRLVDVPKGFKGSLNVTYGIQTRKDRKFNLQISNKLKNKDSLVVCGTLLGIKEPDRYIIIGNHRDAWVYGAADPVSGSAVMTEVVRALGKYKKDKGFRPRRSIMACSWGAEEEGMITSTEWAEEHTSFLINKVIAYLNVDTAVQGNYTIETKGLDHIIKSVFDAAKLVHAPGTNGLPLYDDILQKQERVLNKVLSRPTRSKPGGLSDHKTFYQRFGIAISDYRYTYSKTAVPPTSIHYGHYHTLYDSFDWMSRFVDPGFIHHLTIGRLWLTHALILADSRTVPLDVVGFAKQIRRDFRALEKDNDLKIKEFNVTFSFKFAKRRINALLNQTKYFQRIVNNISAAQDLSFNRLRVINDKIMNFERNFILPSKVGYQGLKQVHVKFSGVRSALKQPSNNWDNVRKELSLLVYCIDMAIRSLDLSEITSVTSA